jgi:hypothetical protein
MAAAIKLMLRQSLANDMGILLYHSVVVRL